MDDSLAGGVQAITRTPNVFEYIYRNFALTSEDTHADGHYVLAPVDEPSPVRSEPLTFSRTEESLSSGMVRLKTPTTCGLIRVEMQLSYTRRSYFLRLSGIQVYLSDGDQRVWQGSIRALEPDQRFVTYISPLEPSVFHKVFGAEPVHGVRWDKLEYRSAPADLLGAKATHVEIFGVECLDPQKFGESTGGYRASRCQSGGDYALPLKRRVSRNPAAAWLSRSTSGAEERAASCL
jgi:hypothetical protein